MQYLRGYSFLFVGALLFLVSSPLSKNDNVLNSSVSFVVQNKDIPSTTDEKIIIRISSVGDIMAHQTQLTA